MNAFIETITSTDPHLRNRSFYDLCRQFTPAGLLDAFRELDQFRKRSDNLYDRVRAILFLYAGYRFFLMESPDTPATGKIPYEGFEDLLARRFETAITRFLDRIEKDGPNATLFSGLAEAYHHLSFQILADQVRRKRAVEQGQPVDVPRRPPRRPPHPHAPPAPAADRRHGSFTRCCEENTSVRMDLTHSGWSDIFFLGMDYPEGARVINVSMNLGVYGRDQDIKPPIRAFVRVIPEPVLRLTSIDLNTTKDVTDLADLFNFGNDYLSLVKAGVIASGLIPPSFEGTNQSLRQAAGPHRGAGHGHRTGDAR